MADVSKMLKHALTQLQKEKSQIDRQISALESALGAVGGSVRRRVGAAKKAGKKRRTMSAAARKAVSTRMKKFWAEKRKGQKAIK